LQSQYVPDEKEHEIPSVIVTCSTVPENQPLEGNNVRVSQEGEHPKTPLAEQVKPILTKVVQDDIYINPVGHEDMIC